MVVSPVSLTTEEVQLPPGARQKQPTLLGLGAALGVPALSEYEDVDPEPDELADGAAATRGSGSSAATPPASGQVPPDPEDVGAAAQRLADFALKLSIGPVSRLWLPDVRSAVQVLHAIGKERKEPTLALVSSRLIELIASAPAPGTPPSAAASGIEPAAVDPAVGVEPAVGVDPAAVDPAAVVEPAVVEPEASAGSSNGSSRSEASPAGSAPIEPREAASHAGTDAALPGASAALGATPSAVSENPDAPALTGSRLQVQIADVSGAEVGSLEGELRERLLHEVARLAGLVPEWPPATQDLAEETRRRETRLVRELLESIDGLRRDHRARVAEQMRLEELAALEPAALAEEFETPIERAAELSQVIGGYRQRRRSSAPDVGNLRGIERALAELERAQEHFEASDPERKDTQRLARAVRRRAMTALWLELAERGELEQLELLEPLSVTERVERLRQWLEAGAERASWA